MTSLPPDSLLPDSLPSNSELLRLQTDFTQHLRNPDAVPVPAGLDERRMGIYSDLIFHNISALMEDFFPVIYSLTDEQTWAALIREFFINYRATTPYFPKLADEFLSFLMNRPGANHEPDYLVPLAHYEWLELCLFTSEAELPTAPLSEEALLNHPIHLTELALPLAYDFPVHQIQPGWQETQHQTCLLLFRDQQDDVRFFELQPLAYELLSNMQQNGDLLLTEWLKEKAIQFNQQDNPEFIPAGITLVQQFNREHLFYD